MRSVYSIALAATLLVLTGCGNKGDLFLDSTELSDEQKALLDELGQSVPPANPDGEIDPPASGDVNGIPDNAETGDAVPQSGSLESNETEESKKKKKTGIDNQQLTQ